jgi:hypothetical protein
MEVRPRGRAAITKVLLVGGATRMPAVRRFIGHMTGLAPEEGGVDPDEAVALGAAVQVGVVGVWGGGRWEGLSVGAVDERRVSILKTPYPSSTGRHSAGGGLQLDDHGGSTAGSWRLLLGHYGYMPLATVLPPDAS